VFKVLSKGERMAAERTLNFYQIYYDDSQLAELYPFAIPYKNETLHTSFENSVIQTLVPQSTADLISVCSWRLRQKREDMWVLKDKGLSYEKITKEDYDVAVLTPRSPSHKPLHMASMWHGKAWDDAISDLRSFIKIPRELSKAIYENHFIATRSVYHAYVADCLSPVMEYCRTREVYYADSGYARRKTPEERDRYYHTTGRRDWPIMPFILERLFSIWIHGKQLKIINL
jgi:hypothetical protein